MDTTLTRKEKRTRTFKLISEELRSSRDPIATLHSVVGLVREISSCSAVILRLQREGVFAYVVHKGLPGNSAEPHCGQCLAVPHSRRTRGGDGKGYKYSCICRALLSGRLNPLSGLFEKDGACWTNSFSLLCQNADADIKIGPGIGNCPTRGYESAAIVPIKTDRVIIGHIMVLYRESGRLSPELIKILEETGCRIGSTIENCLLNDELKYCA